MTNEPRDCGVQFANLTAREAREMTLAYEQIVLKGRTPVKPDEAAGAVAALAAESQTPPAAPAPQTPAAPAPGAPVGEVDKNGVPWNEKFHAGSKRLSAKGEWALKKGVNRDELAAWVASIKQQQPAAPGIPATNDPGTPPVQPAAPAPDLNALFGMNPATAPQIPAAVVTYDQFARKYNELAQSGRLNAQTAQHVMAVCEVTDPSQFAGDNATANEKRARAMAEFEKIENAVAA